jgi:hypothetical protein
VKKLKLRLVSRLLYNPTIIRLRLHYIHVRKDGRIRHCHKVLPSRIHTIGSEHKALIGSRVSVPVRCMQAFSIS